MMAVQRDRICDSDNEMESQIWSTFPSQTLCLTKNFYKALLRKQIYSELMCTNSGKFKLVFQTMEKVAVELAQRDCRTITNTGRMSQFGSRTYLTGQHFSLQTVLNLFVYTYVQRCNTVVTSFSLVFACYSTIQRGNYFICYSVVL